MDTIFFNNKEYVTNCSYKVSDKGYVITDEYKITYIKGKIKYLDGGSFTHETVLELNEDCDGFWIETTNKLWKFDYK